MNKFFGHLRTIMEHRKEVRKLCFKCGLYWQGLVHDLSKYSYTEFWNGVRYYTGTCSPHIKEREAKGYSDAWLHHKSHNKHHADYWVDISDDSGNAPVPMPIKYLAEMICDRIAACKIYMKDQYSTAAPINYYLSHYTENEFHPETRAKLERYLSLLADTSEKMMMKRLKEDLKK